MGYTTNRPTSRWGATAPTAVEAPLPASQQQYRWHKLNDRTNHFPTKIPAEGEWNGIFRLVNYLNTDFDPRFLVRISRNLPGLFLCFEEDGVMSQKKKIGVQWPYDMELPRLDQSDERPLLDRLWSWNSFGAGKKRWRASLSTDLEQWTHCQDERQNLSEEKAAPFSTD